MGTIFKRGRCWYVDYYNAVGKRIRRKVGTRKQTAADLLDEAEGKRGSIRLGTAPDARCEIADPRLEDLQLEYLDHQRLHRRPRTVESTAWALERILPRLGVLFASQLGVRELERYQAHQLDSVSRRTVNIETGALKAMLNWAVTARLLRENPLAALRPLRVEAHEKKPRRALEAGEARALVAAARECCPRYADIFLCALHTGLRRGELLALSWKDVDFRRGQVRVRAEVAKTHTARRVPMSAELAARLKIRAGQRDQVLPLARLVRALAARNRRRGEKVDGEALEGEARKLRRAGAQRVFTTEFGTPVSNNVLHKLRQAVKRAGIDQMGVDLHALRYSFGTWLVGAGVNVKVVASLLGHASAKMTLDVYTDAGALDVDGAVMALPTMEAGAAVSSPAPGSGHRPILQIERA